MNPVPQEVLSFMLDEKLSDVLEEIAEEVNEPAV
jgi:hypothetical protein